MRRLPPVRLSAGTCLADSTIAATRAGVAVVRPHSTSGIWSAASSLYTAGRAIPCSRWYHAH